MNRLWRRVLSRWRKHVSIPLFSAEGRQDPYPYYKELRQVAPVHWVREEKVWTVTRFEDVRHVLSRPDVYLSSNLGSIESSLLGADGPGHDRVRRIVSKAFTTERLSLLENRIRELATKYVERMAEKRHCDLIEDLAKPIPIQVVATILDLDLDRCEDYSRWSDAAVISDAECPNDEVQQGRLGALADLDAFVVGHLRKCRSGCQTGFFSTEIVSALSDKEAIDVLKLLMIAGHATTAFLLGNVVFALLQYPDVMESVRANPALLPDLIEETLRINSPGLSVTRRPAEDVELAGQCIPKDATMYVAVASANHSEDVFPEPERFRLDRPPRPHLAFGAGVHFCPGSSLSRLEARIVLETLLTRLCVIEADEPLDKIKWTEGMKVRSPKRLKVTVRAF